MKTAAWRRLQITAFVCIYAITVTEQHTWCNPRKQTQEEEEEYEEEDEEEEDEEEE